MDPAGSSPFDTVLHVTCGWGGRSGEVEGHETRTKREEKKKKKRRPREKDMNQRRETRYEPKKRGGKYGADSLCRDVPWNAAGGRTLSTTARSPLDHRHSAAPGLAGVGFGVCVGRDIPTPPSIRETLRLQPHHFAQIGRFAREEPLT